MRVSNSHCGRNKLFSPSYASKSHGGIYEILGHGKNGFLFNQNNKSQLKKLFFLFYKMEVFFKKALLAHKNLNKFSPKKQ